MQVSTSEIFPILHTIQSTDTAAASTGEEFLFEAKLWAQNRYARMGCGLYNEENSIPSFDIFILSQEMTSVNRRLLNLVLNNRHRKRKTSTVTKEITQNAISPLMDTSRLIMSTETV
jgi:hypothetical protein